MVVNVLEYLENSANKYPDKIAFADSKNFIVYKELIVDCQKIGSYIQRKYRVRNKPIGVVIDRDIESLIMFLGVTYSGNFYVPIDPELPSERIDNMLNVIKPICILENEKTIEQTIVKEKYNKMVLGEIDEILLSNIRNRFSDTDPLYSVFTSGSTGIPKAVLIAHRSVIDLVENFKITFLFSEDEIFGNQAPFDYDASVKDIYSTLLNGATLNIISKQLFSFPIKLIDYVNVKKISCVFWTASVLCIIANLRAFKKKKPEFIKKVLFSGEVLPIKTLNYWKEYLPDVMYVNLYGPTEITCNCTYYIVDRDFTFDEKLPIGIPFRNTDVIVINDDGMLVKEKEIGELCVRGRSLALGYYNNIEKTREVFCQNPLIHEYPDIIYRTGDLVQYNENGMLEYCSRKDFQIKHMGHRIELSEIETAVNALNEVQRSCCIYDANHEKIILIYQAENACEEKIISFLSKKVPKYMIPTSLNWVEEIPIGKTGKIDRNYLKSMFVK